MRTFQITSAAGMNMGTYQAETREDAIRQMNRDAECPDLDRDDGLTVTEVQAPKTSITKRFDSIAPR